jgi:shikimate kinase
VEESTIRRIALIGYRGTGKSTVGDLLAARLGWDFVDMDRVLTQRFGTSIAHFVAQNGWEAFREAESALLGQISREEGLVVATGGGIVEKERNGKILRDCFHVVWLDCDLPVILQRLALDPKTATQRPSLTGRHVQDETSQILERRRPLYRLVAHVAVDSGSLSAEEIAEVIARNLAKTGRAPRRPVEF